MRALTRARGRVSYLSRHSFGFPSGLRHRRTVLSVAPEDTKGAVSNRKQRVADLASQPEPGPWQTDGQEHSRRQIWHSGAGVEPEACVYRCRGVPVGSKGRV